MSTADAASAGPRRSTRWTAPVGTAAGLLALVALIAVACSVSNDDVESDEFFRPPAPFVAGVGSDEEAPPASDDTAPADTQPRDDAGDDAQSGDDSGTPDNLTPVTGDDDELELAEDIVRRYRNPTYGYSLELVCGPFCDVNPGGIDRVGFQSASDPAIINISARTAADGATLDDLEIVWRESVLVDTTPSILSRQQISLAADGVTPALLIDWEVDRRATGGSLERWRSLITQVGPVAYFINTGSLAEFFPDLERFFQQSLDSFLALPQPSSLPGLYTRFNFTVAYDIEGFVGELPLPGVANQPTADGGRFFFQNADGVLEFILTWESLSQAIYDPDTAIDAQAQPPAAVSITEDARGDFQLTDDIAGRFGAFSAADAGGNVLPVRVFSWYCEQGGRSFTLQSLSVAERPPVLDGFRCNAPEGAQ